MTGIKTRAIPKVVITGGTAGDAPTMTEILKSLKGLRDDMEKGDATLDSAYPTRRLCNLLKDLGWTTTIKPKSNTASSAKGGWAWKDVVQLYMNGRDRFGERYRQRSMVEAAYSAIKAMYGASLRTRLMPTWTTEATTHVIATSRW